MTLFGMSNRHENRVFRLAVRNFCFLFDVSRLVSWTFRYVLLFLSLTSPAKKYPVGEQLTKKSSLLLTTCYLTK